MSFKMCVTKYITFFCFSRAQSYAERLRLGLAVIHGEAQCSESDMADGRHSPPCVRNTTGHTGLELPCKNTHFCFWALFIFFAGFPCRLITRDIIYLYRNISLFIVSHKDSFFYHTMVKFNENFLIISASLTPQCFKFTTLHCIHNRKPFQADDSAVSHSYHQPYSKKLIFCVTACFNSTDTSTHAASSASCNS